MDDLERTQMLEIIQEKNEEIETLRRSLADAMEINSEVRDERDEWKRRSVPVWVPRSGWLEEKDDE